MDSITQALLGASIGEAMLGKRIGVKGALLGAAIATVPDLDVILHLVYDKLTMLRVHRGFSHSILFCFLGSTLLSLALKRLKWTREQGTTYLWLFAFLCLSTHVALDAFTAYGTQILNPFSDLRFGFDSINVVDPVYSVPLLIGLLLSRVTKPSWTLRNYANALGLILSTTYLLLTLGSKQIIESKVKSELLDQHIDYSDLLTVPVGIGNIHWYAIAKGRDSLFIREVSHLESKPQPYVRFPINENLLDGVDQELRTTMTWFAKGFYTVSESEDEMRIFNLQVDTRGFISEGGELFPTAGYFSVAMNSDHRWEFGSGTILKD